MKKAVFSAILAGLMLASAVGMTACGQGGNEEETETKKTETAPESESESTDDGEITRENTPDTLPADLDFGGEDIRILYRGGDHDVQVEITAEDTGDVVDSSIFNRNIAVEDRLNIKLQYEPTTDDIPTVPRRTIWSRRRWRQAIRYTICSRTT